MEKYASVRGISLNCCLCKRSFHSEVDLINHSLNHSFDPYYCNKCDEKFFVETELSKHLKCHEECLSSQNTNISKCSEDLTCKIQVANHQSTHTELSVSGSSGAGNSVMSVSAESVKSDYMSDSYSADGQDPVNQNSIQHSDQSLYECVICNENFSNKSELVRHGGVHLHEKSSMRKICTDKFRECASVDEMKENSCRKKRSKVYTVLKSADTMHGQNLNHSSSAQKNIYNSPIPAVSNQNKIDSSYASDACRSVFQSQEVEQNFSADNFQKSVKSSKAADITQNDHCVVSNDESFSEQNKISNIKYINSCNESESNIVRKNYNEETQLEEDYIYNIEALIYDSDTDSLATRYEVYEFEIDDTNIKSPLLQNSDIENTMDNTKEFYNEDTNLLNNTLNQPNDTDEENMVTDITKLEKKIFSSDSKVDEFIKGKAVIKCISPYTKDKTNQCHLCKKTYSSKIALIRHMYLHSGQKPFTCEFCNKRFARSYDLKDHLLTHTGDKPFVCSICDKSFIRKNCLERHVLVHSAARPYLCNVCGKRFSQKRSLVGHRLIHVHNKPFMCTVCDETFSDKEACDAHRETHAAKVTYVCVLCKRHFKQRRHLERHYAIHTGDKPFRCDMCNKQFSRKDGLTSHKKSHMKQQSLKCIECKESFHQKRSFLRHLQKHAVGKISHDRSKEIFLENVKNENKLFENILS